MKRKTISYVFFGLMILSFISLLASCSSKPSQFVLQNEYVAQNDFTSPYLYFEKDDSKWYAGQGRVYDHNLNGHFELNGDMIVCTESYWNISMELELIGNDRIKIISIKDNDHVLDWLNEGDVLTFFAEAPTV